MPDRLAAEPSSAASFADLALADAAVCPFAAGELSTCSGYVGYGVGLGALDGVVPAPRMSCWHLGVVRSATGCTPVCLNPRRRAPLSPS